MSSIISVQLDAVAALAHELAVLAADLGDATDECRSAAGSMLTALGGDEGWAAGAAATAWAGLSALVAANATAIAGTLEAAVADYRAADAVRAAQISSSPRQAMVAVP